jgi:hypothetical protein
MVAPLVLVLRHALRAGVLFEDIGENQEILEEFPGGAWHLTQPTASTGAVRPTAARRSINVDRCQPDFDRLASDQFAKRESS